MVLAAIASASCSEEGPAVETEPPASTAPSSSSHRTTAAIPLEDTLQQTLQDWYGSGDIGGAVVAVGLGDGSVYVATTGDGAPGEPAGADDTMRIGSITKTFMAALTLRLHDSGVLDVDDPVAHYLPDLQVDETVTVRALLAHTSGVTDPDPEALLASIRADPGQRFTYPDLIELADIPDGVEPRSHEFVYANAGYHLVGGVIEAATGKNVADILRAEVLEPAGLVGTYLAGAEDVPTPIVPGNIDLDGDGREDTLAEIPYLAVESHAWTAGALVSTPADLIQFARALFEGSVISDQALDWMTDTSAAAHGHGLGIFDLAVDGATVYGNSGGGPGFHADLAHDPERDTTAVVFTNCPSCAAGGNDTWQLLVDLLSLAGQPVP
jgi:D-alanyl-D-alanine carboxypeptidase